MVGGSQERRCNLVQFLVHDTAITSWASDSCPFDGFWMYCYQFNSAAFPTWFLPYVTFLVPMPALNIVVFGVGTPVDYLFANLEILVLFPNNSKHGIVYFGGHRHNTD